MNYDTYTAMLRTLDAEAFAAVLAKCGRKAREGYFARHQIRAPKTPATAIGAGHKQAARNQKLWAVLQQIDDEPLAEELLRQLFLLHRPLLGRALETLAIPHDDGLTDDPSLKRFGSLSDSQASELANALRTSEVAGAQHADIYVAFMRAQMRGDQEEASA